MPGPFRPSGLPAAYPNPFNPRTAFTLAVQVSQQVRLAVYDALGRRVAVLHEGPLEAGTSHRFAFDGAYLPSGTYLVRVDGETFGESFRVVLVK